MKSMECEVQSYSALCPSCKGMLTLDNAMRGTFACPHCSNTLLITGPDVHALHCPRCGCGRVSGAVKKLTGAGVVTVVLGICLVFAFLTGLILIFAAFIFMRERRFQCQQCGKWF